MTVSARSYGDTGPEDSGKLILLIEPERGNVSGFEELRVALEAHLGSSEISVRRQGIRALPHRLSAQESRARELAEQQGASAVIWIDVPRHKLSLLFTDTDGNEQQMRRRFNCISQDLTGCGDAIASAVSSALSCWIDRGSASKPAALEPAEHVEDNELSPVALDKISWNEPTPLVRLFGDVGYGFSFFKGTRSFTHGLHLGFGTLWIEHIRFEVSTELVRPIKSAPMDNGARMELNRWPIRIVAGGALSWRQFTFGLVAGLVLDLNSFREVTDKLIIDGVDRATPGFATAVSVRYNILSWLAVWLDGGLDVFPSAYSYSIVPRPGDRQELNHCGALLGHFAFGVALEWEIQHAGGS